LIAISIASEAEMDDIVELFHRIDLHYFAERAPDKDEVAAYVRRNLFQAHCGVRVAIAREGAKPLGLATFAILYPAPGMTGQLFMKDLFTVREARGKGVGKEIMRFLARHALENGCNRFDWTAETDNRAAIEFYDRMKIPRVEEKVYYRLTGEKLRDFAGDEP
jgi:GNAT superfamily N-acetyltransferase